MVLAVARRRLRSTTATRSGHHARRSPTSCSIGYSAWPGWFPLAVAEEKGSSKKAGLDVELTYFVDYIASLDALVAGKVDVNSQTLNDTMLGVAAGSDQRIVVVNDNSTGNDAIICDSDDHLDHGSARARRSPPRPVWSITSCCSRASPRRA